MPTSAKEILRKLPASQQKQIKVRTKQLIEEDLALRRLRRQGRKEQDETGRSARRKG